MTSIMSADIPYHCHCDCYNKNSSMEHPNSTPELARIPPPPPPPPPRDRLLAVLAIFPASGSLQEHHRIHCNRAGSTCTVRGDVPLPRRSSHGRLAFP